MNKANQIALFMMPILTMAAVFMGLQLAGLSTGEYREFLEKWEGRKNVPYVCTGGNVVVGIGHSLYIGMDHDHLKPGAIMRSLIDAQYYSDDQIDDLFKKDLEKALEVCDKNIRNFSVLPRKAKLVLVSIVFTVGPTGFAKMTTLRKAISDRDFKFAAKVLREYKWSSQVGEARAHDHIWTLESL